MKFTYSGLNRHGNPQYGSADTDLETFVKDRFRADWRRLTVKSEGREIGGIAKNYHDTKREWWCETPDTPTESS